MLYEVITLCEELAIQAFLAKAVKFFIGIVPVGRIGATGHITIVGGIHLADDYVPPCAGRTSTPASPPERGTRVFPAT